MSNLSSCDILLMFCILFNIKIKKIQKNQDIIFNRLNYYNDT